VLRAINIATVEINSKKYLVLWWDKEKGDPITKWLKDPAATKANAQNDVDALFKMATQPPQEKEIEAIKPLFNGLLWANTIVILAEEKERLTEMLEVCGITVQEKQVTNELLENVQKQFGIKPESGSNAWTGGKAGFF